MQASDKHPRRRYDAPRRAAGAARTRSAILVSAKRAFEERGWAGATIPSIAEGAKVSHQTVEAVFGTKASLLRAAVELAIRGDTLPVPMPGRDAVLAMEASSQATELLDLHTVHIRSVNERSARLARVVEDAASSSTPVAQLWAEMTQNRRFAAAWAASTLLGKPDAPPGLERPDVEETFWLAIDWATYRSLTDGRGLSPDGFEAWLRRYYRRMLGA